MAEAQLPLKDDVKSTLFRTDETFRQLVTEHQTLDERIHQLDSFAHLTDQQRFEQLSLKKQKLALKDRIEAIVRHTHGVPASAPQH
jgi:uncharacterized protein YdcH (DUF465 family)